MSIIVAGKLILKSGARNEFIDKSREAISQARKLEACDDFSVSPDPIDENRVNIFEKWSSREELDAFRNSGPDNGSFALVESFHVKEYELNT
ncbi:putative quinol monooxygenase [Modicisalibacter radicis]|uniref:putative quinol monooxygenase n=1 Tax=Halomonas sp. EAR18 TaxID=2518972 RepID=UPI00109C65B9|nr:antibiotic biosynthesis monooxygenase [Halomonas sp. EAR18]